MNESYRVTDEHLRRAQELVDEAHANGGLAPVDLDAFWADDAVAKEDAFADSCPQVPLGIGMNSDCCFTELGEEEQWYRLFHDEEYRLDLHRRYNDIAERIVGRRLLREEPADPARQWQGIGQLHDIFEARNEWLGNSYWLHQSADSEDELAALLDRVEARIENLREFMLPEDWDEQKQRVLAAGGSVPLYRSQRGPVTFAMSVYGPENLVFLIMDNEPLAKRFSDLILRAMIARGEVLDAESEQAPEDRWAGFSFADDNCALLSPGMYEFFAYPIVEGVFNRFAPGEDDWRFQHSDSDMAHLVPLLGKLDFKGVNFGPKVLVDDIRGHMPRAVIRGCLAPFTFSRNEETNIVAEFLRDFEMARECKGLQFETAGSINDGSRLTGMRLAMAAIQRWGRY